MDELASMTDEDASRGALPGGATEGCADSACVSDTTMTEVTAVPERAKGGPAFVSNPRQTVTIAVRSGRAAIFVTSGCPDRGRHSEAGSSAPIAKSPDRLTT